MIEFETVLCCGYHFDIYSESSIFESQQQVPEERDGVNVLIRMQLTHGTKETWMPVPSYFTTLSQRIKPPSKDLLLLMKCGIG